MDFFTQKEKDCLAVYVTDLLGLMEEEHTSIICDSRYAYHKEEIQLTELLPVQVKTRKKSLDTHLTVI